MTVDSLSGMSVFVCVTAGQSVRFIFALITCRENHTYAAQYYFQIVSCSVSLNLYDDVERMKG